MAAPEVGYRLLIILTHPSTGGAGGFARWLGQLLAERGHQVAYLYLYGDGERHEITCLLPDKPRGLLDYARILGRCWRFIRTSRPDAVHGVMPLACVVGSLAGLFAGCRSRIAGQHQVAAFLHPLMLRLDRICGTLGIYTAGVACSRTARDSVAPPGSRYARRSTVIYNTVRPLGPLTDRATTRRRYAIVDNAFVIGMVGEISQRKNQIFLVELLPHLAEARLVLVGTGPATETLAARARALGVGDRLQLFGQVPADDVPALLAAIDVFGFPSLGEAFPLAILEAMRAGVAIVASDIGMNVEALRGKDAAAAGLVLPVSEPARWREAFESLATAPEHRARLGHAAAERFGRFSPEAMAAAYERLFFQPWGGDHELYTL